MNNFTLSDVASFENLYQNAKECINGVLWKRSVQEFRFLMAKNVAAISQQLFNGTYKSKGFVEFWIWERGKRRFIQSVHITERMVQKSLCNNVLKPLVEPLLIPENCASRKGYGTQTAINNIRTHLIIHYEKYGIQGGILLIDLHDYFHSISHQILIQKYKEIITDTQLLDLISYFICCFDKGLGLGSEISQISAIFYANDIDHYIKDIIGIQFYGRYMDDSYVIYYDLCELKHILHAIQNMYKNLGIELNNKKTQIIPFEKNDFAFLKKRIHLNTDGTVVMRPVHKKFKMIRRKLKKMKEKLNNNQITMGSVRQTYRSIRGELVKYNCQTSIYNIDKLYLKLFNENYDGATIEDIAFKKNLYVMSRNKTPHDIVGKEFRQWLDKTELFSYKKTVIKNMKKVVFDLYQVRWNKL